MTTSGQLWPVAVFAHNEANSIIKCLETVLANRVAGQAMEIHVLANACSDNTEQLVRDFARTEPCVHLHSIVVGDKANAWNCYIHDFSPDSDVHFFIDGDVEASAGALAALADALAQQPHVNAAAALPVSGRAKDVTRATMLAQADLAGNLYALSGDFVRRLRAGAVKMPVGFIGEDSLVGAFAKYDLDTSKGWNDGLIVPVAAAGFYFDSLNWRHARDWRLYWNRRIRYSMRTIQLHAFRKLIQAHGFQAMPAHVRDLYPDVNRLGPIGEHGENPLFDFLAKRRIRKQYGPQPIVPQPVGVR